MHGLEKKKLVTEFFSIKINFIQIHILISFYRNEHFETYCESLIEFHKNDVEVCYCKIHKGKATDKIPMERNYYLSTIAQ